MLITTRNFAKGKEGKHEEELCAWCLGEITTETPTKTLKCGHRFCKTCIEPWLEQKGTCITCRAVECKVERKRNNSPSAVQTLYGQYDGGDRRHQYMSQNGTGYSTETGRFIRRHSIADRHIRTRETQRSRRIFIQEAYVKDTNKFKRVMINLLLYLVVVAVCMYVYCHGFCGLVVVVVV